MNKMRKLIAAGAAVLTIASVSGAALAATESAPTPTPSPKSETVCPCGGTCENGGNGYRYSFVDENKDGICDRSTDGTRGSGSGNAYGNRGKAGTGRGQAAGRMNGGRGANCDGSGIAE